MVAAIGKARKTAVTIRQIGFQDLGVLYEPLVAGGYAVRYLDAFAEDPRALDPVAADVVVVLGGPYGAQEGDTRLFIDAELDVLRVRLAARRPTFGICLGAQLMARALDADVRRGAKEIGWTPVTLTDRAGPLAELAGLPVLHWHGDTFDLPDGAVRLAGTDLCANQAFALGTGILALQFHVEVDPRRGMDAWIACHAAELRHEGIDPDRLVAAAQAASLADRSKVPAMFARWLARAAEDHAPARTSRTAHSASC